MTKEIKIQKDIFINVPKNPLWVPGGFKLWLVDYSPERPFNLSLQYGENLNMTFDGREWAELFYVVLNCPTFQEVSERKEDESASEAYERSFKEATAAFPMLQELSNIYSKVLFHFEHIEKLREEILAVMPKATENVFALRGLQKLKEGCDKALEKRMLLYLI